MATTEQRRTFYYRAGAPEGGVLDGSLVADDEAAALAQLRQAGFQPLRIDTKVIGQSLLEREVGWASSKVLNNAACEELCRELALLLGSGIALVEAVGLMSGSLRKGSQLHRLSQRLRQGLRLGHSLSGAIQQSGFVFPSDFVPVIAAGETSGSLVEALKMLALTYRDSGRFSRVFLGALIYPVFLLFVAFATLGIIAFFVAPNLTGMFVSMDKPVPLVISTLSTASSFLAQNWVLLAAAVGAVIVLLATLFSNEGFRTGVRRLMFRLPGIGSALAWSATQKFASTLRLYMASNVPIASALPNAFVASGFPGAKRIATMIGDEVRKGSRI